MITIHKYVLQLETKQKVTMPKGAVILALQTQRDAPCLWVQVNTEFPSDIRTFHTVGTGHEIGDYERLQYIGTYQAEHGSYVFHVFEEVS